MLLREQLQQPVLRVVRVLVLVDEDVAERLLPLLARLGEALEHVDREEEHVVEVDGVRGEEALLVEVVDLGDGLVVEARDALAVLGRADSRFFAFEIWEWMPRGAKRFGSRSSSSRQLLHEAQLVGLSRRS